MKKSVFRVPKMDCVAEESLIRMKLGSAPEVKSLSCDLRDRTVTIYHEGNLASIESALNELGLGESFLESEETEAAAPEHAEQRHLLWTVLWINLTFFLLEVVSGLIAGSMGLVADSLDMLADALVYGLSLAAVGGPDSRKKSVAKWSGYFQMILALLGLSEVLRRFLGTEDVPDFRVMILVSLLALIANSVCLFLLLRSRNREAHMQASMIFTSNDVVINLGVITAGGLVLWSGSNIPDLVVGAAVFVIVSLGSVRILKLGK